MSKKSVILLCIILILILGYIYRNKFQSTLKLGSQSNKPLLSEIQDIENFYVDVSGNVFQDDDETFSNRTYSVKTEFVTPEPNRFEVEKVTDEQGRVLSYTIEKLANYYNLHIPLAEPLSPGKNTKIHIVLRTKELMQVKDGIFHYQYFNTPSRDEGYKQTLILPTGIKILEISPKPNKLINKENGTTLIEWLEKVQGGKEFKCMVTYTL